MSHNHLDLIKVGQSYLFKKLLYKWVRCLIIKNTNQSQDKAKFYHMYFQEPSKGIIVFSTLEQRSKKDYFIINYFLWV